ncbi:hypothetical protein QFZ77_006854 [Paenibacillus sp. V4I3]|uniref:hypothetical protein n=1 Tax=unclassified Paenibacillus TaxID=185978 RepID=UPI002781A98C|nr:MULTISPECIES: hypothetical protein [unclassified Paenibacillus]MDQ0878195.1 hypothetical protein [Paenibacillus sp. V4I3]MDQ0885979.1 hypothetical protein [Paenibacillus sp. V4I9]
MKRITMLIVITVAVFVSVFFAYKSAQKEAISIAFNGQEDKYTVTGAEIVWFKLAPYWNVGYLYNSVEANILVDPLTKEIIAEANVP